MTPKAVSHVHTGSYSESALIEATTALREQMGTNASLGFFFATREWAENLEDSLELIRLHGHVSQLIGCSGSGVLGRRIELEQAGFSLLLLSLPAGSFETFAITEDDLDAVDDASFWHRFTGISPDKAHAWVVVTNPAFDGLEGWLATWNQAYPGTPTVGGIAGAPDNEYFLVKDGDVVDAVLVAVGFTAGVTVESLVSQGCRPIGEPLPITKAEDNLILEIGNIPAYQALENAFLSIPALERTSVRNNLFLGLAVSEYIDEFKLGDFLIRNILGADPQLGALAVGAFPRVGQTVQFQLRDMRSAHSDLVEAGRRARQRCRAPLAILLFSCVGRGRNLFGVLNHDPSVIAETIGDLPLAGFFCNGEIGPVGSQTFLHGYTASAAILNAE
ncbi:MAG: FIST C-terminal domain-containing protein [Verrucomicrobia bacterium]|nr:FIST C-terminal domain-containing protein [Verrucomicrobiota bacterium]